MQTQSGIIRRLNLALFSDCFALTHVHHSLHHIAPAATHTMQSLTLGSRGAVMNRGTSRTACRAMSSEASQPTLGLCTQTTHDLMGPTATHAS